MRDDWTSFFEKSGAVWRHDPATPRAPHARHRLTAHHSGYYFNSDVIVENVATCARVIARGLGPAAPACDVIVAPRTAVTAAGTLARSLGRALGRPAVEYDVARDAFSGAVAGRALVVTDDVHGGGSAGATIRALRRTTSVADALLTLANFSAHDAIEGVRITALTRLAFEKVLPAECPWCRAGSPALDARAAWATLIGTRGAGLF